MKLNQTLISDSVVVIPTLKRPEFLALCLEKISQTPEGQHLDVRIFLDTCSDQRADEVNFVRDEYLPTAEIFRAHEHIPVLSGCWNILNSLKQGYETGAKLIYFVEEDVFIKPEFFDLHKRIHNTGNYFVTCGRRLGKLPLDFYSNPGTCYQRNSLECITPHIRDEYFRDPEGYLNRNFPEQKGMDGFLDDGLIRKVQRSVNGKVLCIDPPIAFHQGFRYYNRLEPWMNNQGDIKERIQRLREMLPKVDRSNRYTMDYEPYS